MDDQTRWLRSRSRRIRAYAPVLLALALCPACASWKHGTTATSFLQTIERSHDPNERYEAYARLASPQCYDNDEQRVKAVRVLSDRLDPSKEPTASRAVICRTLGEIGLSAGRDAVLRCIEDPEPIVRATACWSLGRVGQQRDATTLARIMSADGSLDCQTAAIEGLAKLKPNDPRMELLLVQGMENENPAIRLASVEALREITGKDLGVNPEPWRKLAESRMPKTAPGDDKAVQQAAAKKPDPKKGWSLLEWIPSLEARGLARDKDPKIQAP